MIRGIIFASCYVYSPGGSDIASERSRLMRSLLKDGDAYFMDKYADRVRVDYVFQALDALPAGFTPPSGREKPWGTGHAVWCARETVTEPFAVIGADDYFGRDAFEKLAAYLSAGPESESVNPRFAMVGYRLANTLSENGAVSRGVCAATADGTLQRVVEHTGILRDEVGAGTSKKFTGEEIVSMNCWAFTPALFAALDRQFTEFLKTRGGELKSEFYLPEAVSRQIAAGEAAVRVLPTTASWFGVTYREDKPRVQEALAGLVENGDYPAQLFPTP